MIKRWVHAQIALDDQNNPVGIIYGGTSTFPNPQIKTPPNALQMLQTLQRIEQTRHPPTTIEKRDRAYQSHM